MLFFHYTEKLIVKFFHFLKYKGLGFLFSQNPTNKMSYVMGVWLKSIQVKR